MIQVLYVHWKASVEYKSLLVNWEDHAKRLLAQFRVTTNCFIGEQWFGNLVNDLKNNSSEFSQWWGDQEISGTPIGEKN